MQCYAVVDAVLDAVVDKESPMLDKPPSVPPSFPTSCPTVTLTQRASYTTTQHGKHVNNESGYKTNVTTG
jgi:hypothetical protein